MSSGWQQLQARILAETEAKKAAAMRAIGEVAEQVMAEAKELCPVSPTDRDHPFYNGHSGALRDSGSVKDVQDNGTSISVELGFNTNYAAAVHERTGLNHKYPGAVNPLAQAKFLAVPLLRWRNKMLPYIAGEVERA